MAGRGRGKDTWLKGSDGEGRCKIEYDGWASLGVAVQDWMMLKALRCRDSSANATCGMEMVLAWVSMTSCARAGKEHRAVAMAWM